jgi:hypothetical protein
MMPRFKPIIAACVRSLAPSLERMFLTRPLTVSSVIESWSAICLLAFPAAINRRTLISAGVKASSVACSAISNEASGESAFFPAWIARMVSVSSL